MNILAIDALSPTLSIAAHGPKGLVTQSFTGRNISHAEQLVPLIAAAVSAAGFTAEETELVLAPEGPGSFTGLRLGYAAAKALQLSSNCTFKPVPTLPCLASLYDAWDGNTAALIDAKRERFYIQLFHRGAAITEACDKTAEEMLPYFSQDEQWLITGYGTASFKTAIVNTSARFYYIETAPLLFASAMIDYVQNKQNLPATATDYAGPLYIRKSDAEKDNVCKML